MSLHPIIDLAADRQVRQAKGFRLAAAELTGASLCEQYKSETEAAPRRADAGKKYFGHHPGKPASERKASRDEEHFASALVRQLSGEEATPLELPEGEALSLLDYSMPLVSAVPDKAKGDDDPNKGVGKVPLIGTLADGRLVIIQLKYAAPSATRGGTGDTPLRALLEGLASCAIVDANRAALQAEAAAKYGTELKSEEAPALILLGTPRYWELCRKREAQKGAGWIRELQRLGREIAEEIGVQVFYLAAEHEGDPGWSYDEAGPTLDATAKVVPAWESTAGKLKPKPRPKDKGVAEDVIVEADLSRPPRAYAAFEAFDSGDRIDHPTLGQGVVQGSAGPRKIVVLFDGDKRLLVHERAKT